MKTQIKKPEDVSHVIQNKTKAVKQAPVQEILQRYLDRTVQREAIEDEDELLQGKFTDTAQRMESDEEELLQGKFDSNMTIQKQKMIDAEYKRLTHGWHGKDVPKKIKEKQKAKSKDEIRDRLLQNPANAALPVAQLKPNNTGLPDNVKTGIENLSGYSMDDVRVHYNSDKPAQLQALAYTQGTDIHVAPGQEKHLPHEAWHVVQQKQGRVQPTTQMQGINVNDNKGLENEADVMGGKAIQRMAWVISRELNLGMSGSSNSDSSSSRAQVGNRERGSSHGSSDSSNGASLSGVASSSVITPVVSSNDSSIATSGSSSEEAASETGSKGATSGSALNSETAKTVPQEEINNLIGNPQNIRDLDLDATGDKSAWHKITHLKFHHRHILFDKEYNLPLSSGKKQTNNIGYGGVLYSENSLNGYEINNKISENDAEDKHLRKAIKAKKNYGAYKLLTHNCQHWVNDVVAEFKNIKTQNQEAATENPQEE